MKIHRTLTITTLLLAATATQALAAAAAPAAPAAEAIAAPSGPPIAGMCVFSYDRTIAESTVGRAYVARLQQLNSQAEAELNPERTTLQSDARALEGQRATLPPEQFEQRAEAMNQRIQAYGAKEQLRGRELEQTRTVQLQRIVQQVNPLVVSVYNTRRCSIVFDASSLIATNPAMDITDDVVSQLNTRMSTITFDRERLDAAAAAAPVR
jgi:Skp family chaperone for outer membrane proteins